MPTTSRSLALRDLLVSGVRECGGREKRGRRVRTPTQVHEKRPVVLRELVDSDSIYHKFLNRMIFFDGTSGNIIKTPSPKWLDRNYFCKLFMTITDVSSFWAASDRSSQGQREKKKNWGWGGGPFSRCLLERATIYHVKWENCRH